MHRSCWIVGFVVVAYLVPGTSSVARAGRRISVVSSGTCPAREAVVSALVQAMPDVTIVGDAAQAPGDVEPVVVLSDGGASYRAVVRGVVRTLVDEPAHCEERARKVAIVAALALYPPLIAEPRAVDAVETVVAHAAAPAPSSGIGVRFDSGWVVERAHGDVGSLWPMGGTARLTIERDGLGLVIGGTLVTWSSVRATMFVRRTPIDVALQLRRRMTWIAGALELGPSVVVQRAHDVDGNHRAVHLEADFRLSGRIELLFPGKEYGVFAAVTGTYVPNPAPVSETSTLTMPTWWLGASAGLVLRIR